MKPSKRLSIFILPLAVLCSCAPDNPTPLPLGYFRIDLPESEYINRQSECPFSFEISDQSRLEFYSSAKEGEKCWFDLYYPRYKARIHFTYKNLDDNLRNYIEESRSITYEHHIKASKIEPVLVENADEKVFGLAYELDGNVASPFQFYLTDSTEHFIRGSLYFESKPNQDSIRPVLVHVKKDLYHLIETFNWK